jgi:hypothetical protein
MLIQWYNWYSNCCGREKSIKSNDNLIQCCALAFFIKQRNAFFKIQYAKLQYAIEFPPMVAAFRKLFRETM